MDVDKIALVTDLSGEEERAYRMAATLAGRLDARLELVHVVEQGGRCLRWAEEQLSETARTEPAFRRVPVETVALGGGDPYGLLADFAGSESGRLMVCARNAAETGGLTGSRIFPERLADVCSTPLLVLPEDGDLANRSCGLGPPRVLLPHDLYEEPETTAQVRGLLSGEPHPASFYLYRRPETASDSPGEELFASFERALRGEDDTVHVLLASGSPGGEIVKTARALDVDLIVVCPRGDGSRPGLSSEDLGWVLRHSPCSVLAVRASVGEAGAAEMTEGYELYCG